MVRGFWTGLRNNIGAGLVVLLPIVLSVWLFGTLWNLVNGPLVRLFRAPAPEARDMVSGAARFLHRFFGPGVEALSRPGVGLLILIGLLFVIGVFARSVLGRWIVQLSEAVLARLPIIRTVYGGTKQILEAILSGGGRTFRDVVMFEYPRKGIYALGFVTSSSRGEIDERTPGELVNVFLPTTPNPTSGFLLMIPKSDLTYLEMGVEDAVRLIMSAGIISPKRWPSKPTMRAVVDEPGAVERTKAD